MVCLAANQVWWTAEVEEVFARVKKGNKRAMKEYLEAQNRQLDDLVVKGGKTDNFFNNYIEKLLNLQYAPTCLQTIDLSSRQLPPLTSTPETSSKGSSGTASWMRKSSAGKASWGKSSNPVIYPGWPGLMNINCSNNPNLNIQSGSTIHKDSNKLANKYF